MITQKPLFDYDLCGNFYSWRAEKKVVLRDSEEQAMFYCMERLAEQYAYRFFDLLSTRDLLGDYTLPLVFKTKSEAILENDCQSATPPSFGFSKFYPKLNAITIILPERKKRAFLHKSLKQYIRHELIHYYLYIKDLPFEDDSFLFWAYCYIFDGNAYEPLNDEEQQKYNRFVESIKLEEIGHIFRLQELAEEMSSSV